MVVIRKTGDALVIVPARKSWESFLDEAPDVDDDFLAKRPVLMGDRRVTF